MLADHVKAQTLQQLQIINHGFLRGRRVDTIRPESLVQRTEHEDEFAVQQWPDDAIHSALGDGPEPGVALYLVLAHLDSDVVQVRRVGRPQLWRGHLELEWPVGGSAVGCHYIAVVVHGDLDVGGDVLIRGVHSHVD